MTIARLVPVAARVLAGNHLRCRSAKFSSSFQDPVFETASSTLRFGPGSTSEVGQDIAHLQAGRVLLFVDPNVQRLQSYQTLMESIDLHCPSAEVEVYSRIRVEPSDTSFQDAIEFAQKSAYDVVVALGGGSTIDTAKAANLYATYPTGDFYDYVNSPVGNGHPVPGPVIPLIAIPTTAGTGSECTGVCIFDDTPTRSKTGIASRALRPALGVVDPENMKTICSSVAKYPGLDVLCHALESYTAIPHQLRPGGRPSSPILRPAYQGSNPVSDIWSMHALQECVQYLPRLVADPEGDNEARSRMCLASSSAGTGFGNAGVHLCHGMSYSVASQVKNNFWTDGYSQDIREEDDVHGLVAHGLSVSINAPAVFRFTGKPQESDDNLLRQHIIERHALCARILAEARVERQGGGVPSDSAMKSEPGEALAAELLELMSELDVPLGIRKLGYTEDDVDSLARGTLPQERVTLLSPRQPVELKDLQKLFSNAMEY